MSHFSVLVIGEDHEEQLAPFHEFECSGIDDQYVQDIDITEEVRKEYDTQTDQMLKAPDGSLHHPDAPRKVEGAPPSSEWEKVRVPVRGMVSLHEFIRQDYGLETIPYPWGIDLRDRHKYGYCLLAEDGSVAKVIDRTNPQKKWDWYVLGGRWTGFFRLKSGASGALGDPGLMTGTASPGTADQARKGDIDFAAMWADAAVQAGNRWDEVFRATGGETWERWETLLGRHPDDIKEARRLYWGQSAIAKMHKIHVFHPDHFLCTREEYTESVSRDGVTTHAVIKDGQWYEKGRMGWWGVVHDKQDEDAWREEFQRLIDDLPDDTLLSVYDCHI